MTDGAVRLDLAALAPDQRAAVVDIARRVQAAGGRALMVGGSVRDLLLGEARVKDVDLEVFGVAPEALCRTLGAAYAFDACGASFGVLKVKHLDIDVALPRREAKRGATSRSTRSTTTRSRNASRIRTAAGLTSARASSATSRRASRKTRCASCAACSSRRASTSTPRRRRWRSAGR